MSIFTSVDLVSCNFEVKRNKQEFAEKRKIGGNGELMDFKFMDISRGTIINPDLGWVFKGLIDEVGKRLFPGKYIFKDGREMRIDGKTSWWGLAHYSEPNGDWV